MNKIGRPLKFKSPEELSEAINTYLDETPFTDWTVTGLALAIGTSRQVLDDYMKRPDYYEIVSRAKTMIENSYEISLRKHGRSGDIFALKNFGWKDKTEQDVNNTGTILNRVEYVIADPEDSGS